MTSHLLTPTHCSSATPNSITVHTKGIRPSFQQYTASTNVTITDYIPHSCEVTGTNNCIMYIRRGPNNHDLKTTYTHYSFNTLSHPGFGRSHWKTREVSDGRCYGRSYAPSTIVWETWIHKTNYTPTTSIFRSLLRTWWSLSSRRGSSSTRGTQHQISLTLHCSLGNVIKGY